MVILPYNFGSHSARNLANAVAQRTGRRVLRVRSSSVLRPIPNRVVLNWGSATLPQFQFGRIINKPDAVNVAGNKLLSFRKLKDAGVSIPEFTTDAEVARRWIVDGNVAVARTVLRGHSGEGIIINGGPDWDGVLTPAPLYVQYKKKKHEFRVHVFNGTIIDVQQKKRERGVEREGVEKYVRSHANGWVFCREDLNLNEENRTRISDLAVSAIRALGLDFGAVDIIFNERENTFYVLEVNTAPGLEGTTLEVYTNAIANLGV
jgi:hypothetical protein